MNPTLRIFAWTAFTVAVIAWIVFWLVPFVSKTGELSKTSDSENAAFDCDRGFRESDWTAQPLKTAQSIEKCDWLDGWTRSRVTQALGKATTTKGADRRWVVGVSKASNGAANWVLTVSFAPEGGVTGTRTSTLRI